MPLNIHQTSNHQVHAHQKIKMKWIQGENHLKKICHITMNTKNQMVNFSRTKKHRRGLKICTIYLAKTKYVFYQIHKFSQQMVFLFLPYLLRISMTRKSLENTRTLATQETSTNIALSSWRKLMNSRFSDFLIRTKKLSKVKVSIKKSVDWRGIFWKGRNIRRRRTKISCRSQMKMKNFTLLQKVRLWIIYLLGWKAIKSQLMLYKRQKVS